MQEQWVSMNEASAILKQEGISVSVSKISRLAQKGTIRFETEPLDERVKLVNVNELRNLFASSRRLRK